mmetsp:Transcript_10602/g.13080  ORF Transcript_10602/g.13080 Transcript_10602/m.13080 type:complete len:258 (-) Transcript_10602:133-906(-)
MTAMKLCKLYLFACAILSPKYHCFSTTRADQNDDTNKSITCNSAIKLLHKESRYHKLNSMPHKWGGHSGSQQQQIVTLVNNHDHSALWIVQRQQQQQQQVPKKSRRNHGDYCLPGTYIKCNDVIRLMHLETNNYLHADGTTTGRSSRSPLSGQGSVTAIEDDDNANNDWRVICSGNDDDVRREKNSGGETNWKRGVEFRLKSVATGRYLSGSSARQFNVGNCGEHCPILEHLEVSTSVREDYLSLWVVGGGGVYLFK